MILFVDKDTTLFRSSSIRYRGWLYIENTRRIIDNANLWCYLMTNCGWKPDYIWEILTSDVKDEIVGAVINKWNQ